MLVLIDEHIVFLQDSSGSRLLIFIVIVLIITEVIIIECYTQLIQRIGKIMVPTGLQGISILTLVVITMAGHLVLYTSIRVQDLIIDSPITAVIHQMI